MSYSTSKWVCGLAVALIVGLSALGGTSYAEDSADVREVAVTFDDLPSAGGQLDLAELQDLTEDLLQAITKHKVPAVGFVNEGKVYVKGEIDARARTLERWTEEGLELGNHTFAHPSFNTTPLSEFQDDVVRGEVLTKPLMEAAGGELRYFRHPFLRTGPDLASKLKFEGFLAERGYTVAPVTVENADYVYALLYRRALEAGDRDRASRVAEAYLELTFQQLEFSERVSKTTFGRNIRHVLLLHANRLNADWFDALAQGFVDRGYKFITLERALEDPANGTEDRYVGPAGVNWLFRWSRRLGVKIDWRSEPGPQPWVQKAYDAR